MGSYGFKSAKIFAYILYLKKFNTSMKNAIVNIAARLRKYAPLPVIYVLY